MANQTTEHVKKWPAFQHSTN